MHAITSDITDSTPKDRLRNTLQLRCLPSETCNGPTKPVCGQSLREAPRPTYKEFSPPKHLCEHVVCFWRRPAGAEANGAQIILPDGCIDIIWAGEQPPFIAGPMTVPLMPATSASAEIIGVRFRPGVAPSLLGVSASALVNQHVPFPDLWPGGQVLRWSDVTDRDHMPAKLEAIAAVIAKHAGAVGPPDIFVTDAARWIAHHPSGSLDGLARRCGLSERQMRRRFDEAIGYGPKKLQRILRMQRLLWLASQSPAPSRNLAQLSLAAGYADQPHMTREAVTLTGTPPSQLLNGAIGSAVSDLFKTATP
jgi:AraC-like DNA-binding protein